MKTHPECLPCFLRQALQVARIVHCPKGRQLELLQQVAGVLSEMDVRKSPPANAHLVYDRISKVTGCEDPYKEIKQVSNEQAIERLTVLRQEIQGTDDELLSAVRFAIAGNIIDYGAFEQFDIEKMLQQCREKELVVDHFDLFRERIDALNPGDKILYLADNCGEIVYDSLLIDYLFRRKADITVAVKDGPIINDALMEDALVAGLDSYGNLITNGGRFPGTVLESCPESFLTAFWEADLVIAKGQGNFESLSEVDRDIFFLLTLKCGVAAAHMAELIDGQTAGLVGKGEMAIYYSRKELC